MKVPEIFHIKAAIADCVGPATQVQVVQFDNWTLWISESVEPVFEPWSVKGSSPTGSGAALRDLATWRSRMAEIVNLRNARKRAKRRREEERAHEARVSHGVSKADRAVGQAERSRMRRDLDEHRIETGEPDEIAG